MLYPIRLPHPQGCDVPAAKDLEHAVLYVEDPSDVATARELIAVWAAQADTVRRRPRHETTTFARWEVVVDPERVRAAAAGDALTRFLA